MANLLSSAVMTGLMSASSHGKLNQLATSVYTIAKSRGDEDAAQRAMGYATKQGEQAKSATEQTREALDRRAQEVREEEQLEQQQWLEAKESESLAQREAARQANEAAVSSATGASAPQPAAIVEFSQEYLDSVQAGTVADAGGVEPVAAAPAAPFPGTSKAVAPEAVASTAEKPKSFAQMKAAVARAANRHSLSMDIRA